MEVEGKGIKITNRKTRSDKKIRYFPYVNQFTSQKLDRLARACGVSPHEMIANDMIETLMNNPHFINWVQDKYKVAPTDSFRLVPVEKNGRIEF